ncbi:MAG: multidrug effflux MFS transporter [Woeseiaceae bacterium]|nr:multidrug effflux MFS transporter [Woeseiaceae bacterium]
MQQLLDKKSFVVTLGLLTGMAALTVDLSLPAIPAMVAALATTLPKAQQIVGVFMAGMACGQIPAGLVSDRIGRMPALYGGMSIFALGAIVAAAANDIDIILAARFVQGFGAASAIVLSRAIVRDVASGRDAARLMAVMTMIFTAAPVIAPSIGALLTAEWGWRAPFVVIAFAALGMLLAIRINLAETHVPAPQAHPLRQLQESVREYFSHRQSIYGLLLLILPPAGYMSIIAVSAALTVDIYGFTIRQYGVIFAMAGISILAGAALNRLLVTRLELLPLIAVGAALMGLAGVQLLAIAWTNAAPFAWTWGAVCLFMFSVNILMSNSTVLALDPLPRIAGVASSIIGTLQNVFGATSAIVAALIYDGSVRNAVVIMGLSGTAIATVFLLRPVIVPAPLVHHPEELARE